jgi:hypothetical protein
MTLSPCDGSRGEHERESEKRERDASACIRRHQAFALPPVSMLHGPTPST